MQALDGLRVLDLSNGPVGGRATAVLADFGADVVKVERPGGDPFRRLGSAPLWLRGKRSVVLDLHDPGGRAELQRLAEGADVAVVSGPSDRAARIGADAERLSACNPALVHCQISGWGARGPYAHYPGYEGVVAAKAGRMLVFSGQIARAGPAFSAVPVASHATSQGAVQGILAALLARERSGHGQRVETSLLQGLLPYDLVQLLLAQLAERQARGVPDPADLGGGMPTLNYHPVMTADGAWIQLGNLLEHLFYAFLDAIELLPELLAEERYQESPARWAPEAIEAARDRILLRVRERDAEEWMRIFRSNGNVAAEPYQSCQEALQHADLVRNGDVVQHVHPRLGVVRQIGPIAQLGETPGELGRPAPEVGEHDAEILGAPVRRSALRAKGDAPPRGQPLAGITVLEIATIIAAPLATALLADLGARVIKVETPSGDPYRHLLPRGVMAVKTNAGKESICIDLKSEAGRELLADLIRRSELLVHNFRPGVPERLGFGYEQARALRPDLVWLAANGYGPHSLSAHRPSAHPVPGAAMGGALHQAGSAMPPADCASLAEMREAARQLMRANEPNPDPNTSVVIASAALLGLWVRERRGIGQAIHVNMLAANAWANADDFLAYDGKLPRAAVDAELLGQGSCYRLYPARSGWVFLALVHDEDWRRFTGACGRADLAQDPRFRDRAGRERHAASLARELEALFQVRDADAWEKLLVAEGVACVRADAAAPGEFLARDPHVRENGFVVSCEHARFGSIERWGPLVTVNGGAEAYGPGALAGEHSDTLLAELGRTPAEIERLRAAGVVASEPVEAEV